uniref:Uncharacterized protein n=1 Tax=Mustela putorius furo TaxID=9669 RepID=M3Y6L4_MUSPF
LLDLCFSFCIPRRNAFPTGVKPHCKRKKEKERKKGKEKGRKEGRKEGRKKERKKERKKLYRLKKG